MEGFIYRESHHLLTLFLIQLMAYQISFDLEENATQEFLSKVAAELPQEPESTEETKVTIAT